LEPAAFSFVLDLLNKYFLVGLLILAAGSLTGLAQGRTLLASLEADGHACGLAPLPRPVTAYDIVRYILAILLRWPLMVLSLFRR
jgi:hypothetical protein